MPYAAEVAEVLHLRDVTVDGNQVEGHAHGGVLVPPSGQRWLVHLTTTRVLDLAVGESYELLVTTREGQPIHGEATLRRSDGQSHLFVGTEIPAAIH
jgi:hypothetical protein